MVWYLVLAVIMVALVVRIVACIRKSRQPGTDWDLTDKYAANDFGE